MPILETKNLTKNFGGLTAVADFSISLEENKLYGLIGPNGAGKTSLFNLLTGVYPPSSGSILFDVDGQAKEVGGLKTYQLTNLGFARTFQNIRLFGELSVLENIKVGMHDSVDYSALSSILRLPKYYQREGVIHENSMKLLEIVDLDKQAHVLAKNLPYGDQRRLEIARALATNPKILFLDEPAAGMNPNETAKLVDLIRFIKEDFDLTIMLIEHDMSLVMNLCEKIFVMEYGRLIAKGEPEEIKNNPEVVKAYLGEG